MTEMDPALSAAQRGIQRLEYELIVRDFTDVLNEGEPDELHAFMDTNVVLRMAANKAVEGRSAVATLINDVHARFEMFTVIITGLAVTERAVLVEQLLLVKLPETASYSMLGFASFRFRGFQISEWRQLVS